MRSALLAIWQADSNFPNGSFAFSYGIEAVAALRGRFSPDQLEALIGTVLRQRWATFDRLLLIRAFRCGDDAAALASLDRDCEAMNLVAPHREGSRRNGASFLAAHARLGNAMATTLRAAVLEGGLLGHLPVMQGAIWRSLGLDEASAQLASGYVTASGIAAAAVRLGAIGALQAQSALQASLATIERLIADCGDNDEPASFLPFIDIAAARHVRADLRLFVN